MATSASLSIRVNNEDKETLEAPSPQPVVAAQEEESTGQPIQKSAVDINTEKEPPEASEVHADVDAAESEELKQRRQALQEAEARLRALPDGHEEIPREMVAVANCTADYHVSAETSDEGAFVHALELAAKAEGLAPPDGFWRGSAMYAQMTISFTLYRTFKNVDWLHRGIDFGRESVQFIKKHEDLLNPVGFRMLYTGRCERLAEGYTLLYEEEGGSTAIQNAVHWQGLAVDDTEPADYSSGNGDDNDNEGVGKRYWRFNTWCGLWVRLMDERSELGLDGVIHLASEHHPCDLDSELRVAKSNFYNVFALECRRWAITRKPGHLQCVLDRTRKVMQTEVAAVLKEKEQKEKVTAEEQPAHDDDALSSLGRWTRDPDNPRHVLRRAAQLFDWFYSVDNEESQWCKHVPTISTVIALWEELRRNITLKTLADMEEEMAAIVCLQDFYSQRYFMTKKATHGWQYDDLNYENCRKNLIISMACGDSDRGEKDRSDRPIEDVLPGPGSRSCTLGTSIVHRQDFTCWDLSGRGWNWMAQRLKFKCVLGGKSVPPTVDDWISGRTDDGQWILGGAVEGRDDDVLEYIRDYGKTEEEEKDTSGSSKVEEEQGASIKNAEEEAEKSNHNSEKKDREHQKHGSRRRGKRQWKQLDIDA